MSLAASAALVREYCRPVKDDTSNWPDATLNNWWDRAFNELKSELCPPFVEADFDLLNTENGDHSFSNSLIAQMAALLIYRNLPGRGTTEENKLDTYFFGSTEPYKLGVLEKLATGENSLFKADGSRMTRTAAAYINDQDVARDFSKTSRDVNGNIIGNIGTLDQFDSM